MHTVYSLSFNDVKVKLGFFKIYLEISLLCHCTSQRLLTCLVENISEYQPISSTVFVAY